MPKKHTLAITATGQKGEGILDVLSDFFISTN
jgi:hypothetical protein